MKRHPQVAIVAALVGIAVVLVVWRQIAHRQDGIAIGAVLPLTGEGAKYGESARKAIELAFSEVNAAGGIKGKPIQVIYEDSQGVPQKGVSAFQKLITVDHVPAVIGDLFSSVTLAMAPLANQNRVVILSPTSSAPRITEAGDYVFRNCASDVFEGRVMGEAARRRLGISTVAILYINNDYGVGIVDVFRKTFTAEGGTVVATEAFPQGATDFRAQLTKAASARPQAIYLVGYKELGQLLKQATELGIKARFLSTVMFEDPEILKVAGPAADGVIYSARAYDPASNNPTIRPFVSAYKARFGEAPDIFAAFSYDAARIMTLAIQRGGPTGDGIREALYSIVDFPGVCGSTSFDRNGDVTQPAFLKTVREGKFVWLGE
jgi:branched-chain amino acid transport system substrate-binding protein